MWGISSTFLNAIKAPHKLISSLTVTVPGGSPVTLQIKTGTLTVDSSANLRRTAQIAIYGDQTVYATVTTPGALFKLSHGLIMGNIIELIPILTGELAGVGEQILGDGTINLGLADLSNWLTRCQFLTPYTAAVGMSRAAVISAVVTAARPGTSVIITATDTIPIASAQTWSTGPLDVITDLSKDGNLECFFQVDGSYLIRNAQTPTTSPVWTASSGTYGVIETAARQRPTDKLYNTVVVQPTSADGSQTWTQQIATITDTTHPRHYLKIGVVPKFWQSPTITSAAQAQAVAQQMLSQVLGTAETLSLSLITNPALDVNDVIRVVTPQINQQPASTFQHFIDSFTLDIVSGDMTMNTRSQVAT